MELRIKFTILNGNSLPLNYAYLVSSWIYSVIQRGNKHYSAFLHNQGYTADSRDFKMFTFSQLDVRPYRIEGNRIQLIGKEISLTVRFFVDSSLNHFIRGLFLNQRLRLVDRESSVDLKVREVKSAIRIDFVRTMQYQCLAPICVSRLRLDGTAEYVHPSDEEFGKLLLNNLVRKSKALQLDQNAVDENQSVQFRLLNTPRKKGIHIKEGSASHTQVIGYLFHFEVQAPPELHEIGYYAGFGEKNSMGFGCVKTFV